MLKNVLKWVFVIAEKEFHLLLDSDSPLESVKEVAFQMIKHCGHVEDQVKAAKAQEEAEKIAKEAVNPPVEPCCESKIESLEAPNEV